MSKKWWEEDNGQDSTPDTPASSAASPTSGKWWEQPEAAEVQPESSTPKFVPRIGGFVPKEEEKWTNPKYVAGTILGGMGSRNIPFLRDLIPMTATEQERTEYMEKNAPTLKKVGDIGASVVAGLPFGAIGAGMRLPGYMATQAAVNTGVNAADRQFHDPSTSIQEQANAAKLDALLGAAGPAIGKAISPNMIKGAPTGGVPELPKIGNFQPVAKGIPGNVGETMPSLAKEGLKHNISPYVEKYVGMPDKWKGILPMPSNLADDVAKKAMLGYLANQGMSTTNQAVLNAATQAPTRSPNVISDEQRRQLEALGGF